MKLLDLRSILHGTETYEIIDYATLATLGTINADYGCTTDFDDEQYDHWNVWCFNTQTNHIYIREF